MTMMGSVGGSLSLKPLRLMTRHHGKQSSMFNGYSHSQAYRSSGGGGGGSHGTSPTPHSPTDVCSPLRGCHMQPVLEPHLASAHRRRIINVQLPNLLCQIESLSPPPSQSQSPLPPPLSATLHSQRMLSRAIHTGPKNNTSTSNTTANANSNTITANNPPPNTNTSSNSTNEADTKTTRATASQPDGELALAMMMSESDLLHTTTHKEENPQGTLWFANLIPLQTHALDPRPALFNSLKFEEWLDTMIEQMGEKNIKVYNVRLMPQEGGAYVDIITDGGLSSQAAADKLAKLLTSTRDTRLVKDRIKAHLVLGRVFAHDMKGMVPSATLKLCVYAGKIEFGKSPSQNLTQVAWASSEAPDSHTVYDLLRPYGKVKSIHLEDNMDNAGAKLLTAKVTFVNRYGAISAKNCLDGMKAGLYGRRINLDYENSEGSRSNGSGGFFNRFPIFFFTPALVSLIIFFVYHLFEPLRIYMIKSKMQMHPSLWLRQNLERVLPSSPSSSPSSSSSSSSSSGLMSNDEVENEVDLSTRTTWLDGVHSFVHNVSQFLGLGDRYIAASIESNGGYIWSNENYDDLVNALSQGQTDSIICLAGPRDSGKTTLLRNVLEKTNTHRVVHIDLRNVETLVTDMAILTKLIEDVGYKPSMITMFEIKQMQEQLLAVSSRGVLAPSTTIETQVERVLLSVSEALNQIKVARERNSAESLDVSNIPVVLVNGMSSTMLQEHGALTQVLMKWVKTVTFDRLANVIVLSDESFVGEIRDNGSISVDVVHLEPASIARSVAFVKEKIKPRYYNGDEDFVVAIAKEVGGCLSDLRELVGRVENNQILLQQAAKEMVVKRVSDLRRSALGLGTSSTRKWTLVQAWFLFTMLCRDGEVDHDEIVFSPFFDGDEAPLLAMNRAGLIEMFRKSRNKQGDNLARWTIKAERPLILTAFREMMLDESFSARMSMKVIDFLIAKEVSVIEHTENQLNQLGAVQSSLSQSTSSLSEIWGFVKSMMNQVSPLVNESSDTLHDRTDFLIKQISKSTKSLRMLKTQREKLEAKAGQEIIDQVVVMSDYCAV